MMANISDWCADHVALCWSIGVVLGVVAYLGIGVGFSIAVCCHLEKSAEYDREQHGELLTAISRLAIFLWPIGVIGWIVYKQAKQFIEEDSDA